MSSDRPRREDPSMPELRTLYSPIEPYETGLMDVGDGHTVYFERAGTPGDNSANALHEATTSDLLRRPS